MNITIQSQDTFALSVDGKPIDGTFYYAGEWNGLVCLQSNAPLRQVIIRAPARPKNIYDLIPRFLGGNRSEKEPIKIDAEIVQADFKLP